MIAAFKEMKAARRGSEAWWDAHWRLHQALRLPPWMLFDGITDELIYPFNTNSVTTGELWREIEATIREV